MPEQLTLDGTTHPVGKRRSPWLETASATQPALFPGEDMRPVFGGVQYRQQFKLGPNADRGTVLDPLTQETRDRSANLFEEKER